MRRWVRATQNSKSKQVTSDQDVRVNQNVDPCSGVHGGIYTGPVQDPQTADIEGTRHKRIRQYRQGVRRQQLSERAGRVHGQYPESQCDRGCQYQEQWSQHTQQNVSKHVDGEIKVSSFSQRSD
ncbi:hypothetical protein Ae707Ps1_6127c [Pseudonocardia sp. Ae707_Ps1]|nr:hypothetical protein Ae707Ps1_6127c [Pseudonocardia sp. Ae707_Ps1]